MYWPPHITVATIVQRNDSYLMVEESVNGQQVFNQPAGHLEPGETLFEAALRETLEETGWEVILTGFVGLYHYRAENNGVLYHRTAFLATPVRHAHDKIDADITATHWLTLPEIRLRPHRSPLVLQSILDAQENGGFPLSLVKHY